MYSRPLLAGLAIVLLAVKAQAGLVIDGGDRGPEADVRSGSGVYSQAPFDPTGIGTLSQTVPDFVAGRGADNFVLSASAMANGVRWWGSSVKFDDLTFLETFTVEIYLDEAGLPGASVTGPMTFTNAATNPTEVVPFIFEQEVKFPPVALTAGEYWVSVSSAAEFVGTDFLNWILADGVFDDRFAYQSQGASYQPVVGFGDQAFEIQVPEPATFALLSMGLLILRRRW